MCRETRPVGVVLAACAWLLAASVAFASERSADRILAEIRAVEIPVADDSTRGDPGATEELRYRKLQAWARKKALILELYRVAPDHAELPALMEERWRRSGIEGPGAIAAELDDVLARSQNGVLRGHAIFRKALLKLDAARRDPREGAAAMAAVEAFLRHDPKDARGADLLLLAARLLDVSPGEQDRIRERIRSAYRDVRRAKLSEGWKLRPGRVGKPFELEFDDAIHGAHVSMQDLRGKVVVIDFWATWCGPCIAEMPAMKQLYEDYRGRGVEFIGVSLDLPEEEGGLDRLRAFVARHEIPWPQYYQGDGWDGDFSTSWGINAIPAVFVVDQEGNLHSTDARGKLGEMIPELLARSKDTGGR